MGRGLCRAAIYGGRDPIYFTEDEGRKTGDVGPFLTGQKWAKSRLVVASSISLASAFRRKLTHCAAPPLPTGPAALGSGWGPKKVAIDLGRRASLDLHTTVPRTPGDVTGAAGRGLVIT